MAETNNTDDPRNELLRSIVSPLTALGIDPDEARANPSVALGKLAGAYPNASNGAQPAQAQPEASSAAVTPAAVTTTGTSNTTPSKTWQDYTREALQKQMAATGAAEQADSQVPTSDTATAELEKQRAGVATPIPLRDPQTGKMLDQYRPTVGQKILRGLKGVGLGVAEGGLRGAIAGGIDPRITTGTGYGDPNKAYQTQEANRQTQEGSLDQQIQTSRKAFEDATARAKARAQEERQTATGYKDVGDIAVRAQGNENKEELQSAQAALAQAKADIADKVKSPTTYEATVVAAQNEADPNGPLHRAMKEMQDTEVRKFKAGNSGRAPTDTELWNQAFRAEYGRPPNAEEVASRKVAGGGTAGGAAARPGSAGGQFKTEADVEKWDAKWYKDRRDQVRKDKLAELKIAGDDADKAQPEMDNIEKQYATDATAHEEAKKALRGHITAGRAATVDEDHNVTPAQTAPAATTPATPKTAPATTPTASSPPKVATRAEIQAFAKAKGMSAQEAERQAKANGYTIK